MGSVAGLMVVVFFTGIPMGAIENGVNVLCMETWRGRDDRFGNGVFHGAHFAFSVGIVFGPLLSIPFLASDTEQSRISDLYLILGALHLLVAVLFFYLSILEAQERNHASNLKTIEEKKNSASYTTSGYFFIGIMVLWYFVYIGLEVTLLGYLTVFGVESDLGLTTAKGAKITSVVSCCYALTRLLGSFAAIKLKPFTIVAASLALLLACAVPLCVNANTNYYVFYLGVSGLGLGIGPIYAAGLTWLEQNIPMTNKIMGAITVSVYAGIIVLPLIMGQTAATLPMIVMYSMLACVVLLSAIFALSGIVAKFSKQLYSQPETNL